MIPRHPFVYNTSTLSVHLGANTSSSSEPNLAPIKQLSLEAKENLYLSAAAGQAAFVRRRLDSRCIEGEGLLVVCRRRGSAFGACVGTESNWEF